MLAPSRLVVASPSPRRLRLLIIVLVCAAALAGGWLLLRDAPLLAVTDVEVSGATGPEAGAIRTALTAAARDMTTLHVREDALRTAVEPFPVVRSVTADVRSPRGLRVTVRAHEPVAVLAAGRQRVPVAADGTLLRGTVARDLPVLEADALPAGNRLGAGAGGQAVGLLVAAPAPLRRKVSRIRATRRGLSVRLQAGPAVVFGTAGRAAAKWAAASRVLADRSSAGAGYIDVRTPERPAAGGLPAADPQPGGVAAPPAP
jgi:cell division protein FtsQ